MTLLEAVSARHSVRKYIDKELSADIIAALQDKIAECNKVGNLNIQLVQNETRGGGGGGGIHGNAVVWSVQWS
jgi:hypothetical protein